jgi:hypothetical protein
VPGTLNYLHLSENKEENAGFVFNNRNTITELKKVAKTVPESFVLPKSCFHLKIWFSSMSTLGSVEQFIQLKIYFCVY